MANVSSEADRLHDAGRNKILRTSLLWGSQFLAILVVAGLQWAGAIRLEEYFAVDPDTLEPHKIWLILAVGAALCFLITALGVLQGWSAMRRARKLREQARQ